MFDVQKLRGIIISCTLPIRKGEEVTTKKGGPIEVVTVDMMPSMAEVEDTKLNNDMEMVDCHFLTVGVHLENAAARREEFIEQINNWPNGYSDLSTGPSYIAVGGTLGDQGLAFQMFALGEVLGLWKVITPKGLGIGDPERADRLAGMGYVMMSGYHNDGGTSE